ncbi:hypothetical protein OKW96_15525 [Sphingobacterium sp. KU25419]|nr:hypothetical protein OKW96_15525 [Sphingobacterium sp. KU25419]
MKKSIGIIFLIIYMFATTQLVEVVKMPILIEHFATYKGSFVDFLVRHYGGHEKDADWETDMKLPFMQSSDIMFAPTLIPDLIAAENVLFRSSTVLIPSEGLTQIFAPITYQKYSSLRAFVN